jgi:hypothetical protein
MNSDTINNVITNNTITNNINKNNTNKCTIEDYLSTLYTSISEKIQQPSKLEKISADIAVYTPKYNESQFLLRYNYNITQLKYFVKAYKSSNKSPIISKIFLNVSGNKPQLVSRLYAFLFLSNEISKIQKIFRGHLQRRYLRAHGPGFKNKSICTNTFDFLSMEPLQEIENEQFFSFKDDDGFIYGFDLLSLHNLIYKCNGAIKNPFNNKPIGVKIVEDFRSLLRLSRVLHINICTELEDVTKEVSNKKNIELKALTLFQNIDALDFYSNAQWFLNLNRPQLIKYIRELIDIWAYRATLTIEKKRQICPPLGNPFSQMPSYTFLETTQNLDDVRSHILNIMEKLVSTGIDRDNKHLGASYVLSALTLVNNEAAIALPSLYYAVCPM